MKTVIHSAAAIMLLLICALSLAAHQDLTARRFMVIPRAKTAPVLKGDLSDPAWRSGVLVSDFISISAKSPVTQQTEARLLWDSKYLYIGVKCKEANLPELAHFAKEPDGAVWQDDCIEVLIDTANAHRICSHIMANCTGTLCDEKCIDADTSDIKWSSKCRVKTGRIDGAWTLEMAVPFSSLGITPTPGLAWGVNICRARAAGAKEFSSWSPTPGGFVQPPYFGHAVLGDAYGKSSGVRILSWGNLSPDTSFGGQNKIECLVPNNGSAPATFELRLNSEINGKKSTLAVQRKVRVAAGQTATVEIPYTPSNSSSEVFTLKVLSNRSEILRAVHSAVPVPKTVRVWDLKDPLFTELLSNTPPGDQKNGSIYWFHSGIDSKLRPLAKEYGLRYSLEEQYKELTECRFMPISQKGSFNGNLLTTMADKYGFKALYLPDYRFSAKDGVPVIDGLPYVLDPRSKAACLNDLKTGLQSYGKYIWGIYTQDEMHERAVEQGVKFFEKMKDTYPYIREVDEQVKKEFGFGKYGIPTSSADENPYRWIAYRKWVNRQILEWQKETFEMTRQLAPQVKVISVDPVAGHNPFQLDAYAPYIDIATHQLYPSGNQNRQEFGFVTKFVVDLMNKPTWPCAHIENYAYSTSPEEVRELMSQVMRNGGKGFHLYIPDVRGNSADKCDTLLTKIGYPERYRAIKEIIDTTYTMNEVAVPSDPDSALLYSEDHFQSFVARDYVYPNEPEYAYTLLGPVARTWFKIVNDNMVADGRANLAALKAIIIPAAKYQRPEVVAVINRYAQGGGTIVCGDPEAFSWATDGSSLESARARLFGAASSPGAKHNYMVFSSSCSLKHLRGKKLAVSGNPFDLKLAGGVEVLAKFDDGRPAVIRNKVGRGSVILFAFNPFNENTIGDADWKAAFKALCSDLGLKTGRDIWRFKFPPFKTVYQPDAQGTCLTGNYIKWQHDRPLDISNTITHGKYSYSLAPDGVSDRDEAGGIGFDSGKLTDREQAPSISKDKLKPEDFTVSWKSEKPVDVTFDLSGAHAVNAVHLWYSDQLPELTVYGSMDGKNWSRLANYPKQPSTQDVLDVSLRWKAKGDIRYVRLSLGDRDLGQAMTLVEAEIWAGR